MTSTEPLFSDLKATSRAFYLSLRFLPGTTRLPIALAYALARAADTIADTRVLPREKRLDHLGRFLGAVRGEGDARAVREALVAEFAPAAEDSGERRLLGNVDAHLGTLASLDEGDRGRIRDVLAVLVRGMTNDLERFPGEDEGALAALPTRGDLGGYCYHVAGVVGEFWTDLVTAHDPRSARRDPAALVRSGVRFGKALQMTNILRDLPRDLRIGRCYVPAEDLARLGLAPRDLLDPSNGPRFAPLFRELLDLALEHYVHGFAYTLGLARTRLRLRMSCALPLVLGVETLGLLARDGRVLDPAVVLKVPRSRVLALLRRSLVRAPFDGLLEAFFRRTLERAGFGKAARRPFPIL